MEGKNTLEDIGANLKAKERKFCEEYLKSGAKMESARAAGYGKTDGASANAATKLLKREDILSYLHALQAEARKQLHIDENWIVLKAIELYEKSMTAIPITRWDTATHQMVETGEYRPDAKGAAKALELIKTTLGIGPEDAGKLTAAITFIEDIRDGNS